MSESYTQEQRRHTANFNLAKLLISTVMTPDQKNDALLALAARHPEDALDAMLTAADVPSAGRENILRIARKEAE